MNLTIWTDFYQFYNGLSSAIKASIIIMTVLAIVSIVVGNKVKKMSPTDIPKGLTFLSVIFVDMVNNMIRPIYPKHFNKFAPLLLTLFMYLLFANTASLFGMTPPLSNISIALSFSTIALVTIQGMALIIKKPWPRFKALLDPHPLFFPLNLIGELSTPFSMGMRLFGNLLSGTVLGILIYSVTGYFGIIIGGLILHPVFDIFFGLIQAYVYFNLFAIFLSLATED